MASLYLGHYAGPDGFEKFVAIKRIHQHLAENAEFCKMFVDEARLAARITHPNVAQVLELGSVDRSYFIAMEYVDGESLNAILRRTRVPLPVGARLISQAAQGLHAAHELRSIEGNVLHVVHRDVSPSNLMITYDGAMKVVDFGVAKARGNTHTTGVQTIKGKFAYIAPEQLRSDGEGPIDRRADIFALGIVLYEATTWRRLFYADNDQASADLVVSKPIAPPSTITPDYPPKLEAIVMRALERKRGDRYQTAHELHLDLETFLAESGTSVLPSTVGKLMQETFPDMIAEKAELMRSCRQMLESTPPAPDEPSSPTVAGAVGEMGHDEGASIHRHRRSLWPVWLAAGLLMAGGAALLLMLQRPAPIVTAAQPADEAVNVELRTMPAEAQIEIDGKPTMNPLRLRKKKGSAPLHLRISAAGHAPRELELGFGESKSWMIALDRLPESRPASQPVVADLEPEPKKGQKGRKTIKTPKTTEKKKDPKSPGVVKDLFKNPYGS